MESVCQHGTPFLIGREGSPLVKARNSFVSPFAHDTPNEALIVEHVPTSPFDTIVVKHPLAGIAWFFQETGFYISCG
jgi:hypothetical protein